MLKLYIILLNAMKLLSTNGELRKKMGNESLEMAKSFDIKKVNSETIALYKRFIDD